MLLQSMKENNKSKDIPISENNVDKSQKRISVKKLREDESNKSSLKKVSFKNEGKPRPV